jgi:hypothetical protein
VAVGGAAGDPARHQASLASGIQVRAYRVVMSGNDDDQGAGWAPAACTLPASERARRAAEFGALLTEAVRGIERTRPTRLRLELQRGAQVAARAAQLMADETQCCSFFTFTLTATGGRLALEVSVPAAQAGVLDALAERAAATASGAG